MAANSRVGYMGRKVIGYQVAFLGRQSRRGNSFFAFRV
jgi:hypothetical protein